METPSSTRRITRSQSGSVSQKAKQEEAPSSRSRNKGNHDRAVLQDITNDSPINGVATEKTPLSSAIKYAALPKRTPGSGEALLRGQVKILLEKVEEEAELVNKLSNRLSAPFFPCLGILPVSPGLLAAPTPANTPQISTICQVKNGGKEEASVDLPMINQVADSVKHEESVGFQESVINRALLFDSPNKPEVSDVSSNASSSVIINQGTVVCSSCDENWSIQANASAYTDHEEDDSEEFEEVEEEGDGDKQEEEEEEEGDYLDELCEGMKKITVEDKVLKLPEFTGKHTRFIYNSYDEIEGEEEIVASRKALSPSVMLLKGLPVPEGKHLRFLEAEEEEE
ncbi:hypothetical protein KSP40_PGU006954 [Platanthera guangdongensis]|uniref:Chalcone-flavanone isomerase family protein n=1 Tax=Platanthera guangdongensis TaxID=2320717 RepID=A0ABR2LLW0_9ASPA